MNAEQQLQGTAIANSLIQRRGSNNLIRQHAMSYPSIDRFLPQNREQYLRSVEESQLNIHEQSPDAFQTVTFVPQTQTTIPPTPIGLPIVAPVVATASTSLPQTTAPSTSTISSSENQKYQNFRKSSNQFFLKYCCALRNFLLAVFIAQSLLSALVTFGFLYYGGQSFLENVTFAQYSESFRTVLGDVEDFLQSVNTQSSIVHDMVRLRFFNTSSRIEWIRVLGSLQDINLNGYITIYIDLDRMELTGVDRRNNTLLMTFNETGSQLFESTYDPITFTPLEMYPHPTVPTFNFQTTSWFRLVTSQYNGSGVILGNPIASVFDQRIVLPAGILLNTTRTPYYDGMILFRYDVQIFGTILNETIRSFTQSRALVVDSRYQIVAASRDYPYILNGGTVIRTTLFNSSDDATRNVGAYFLDKPLTPGNYSNLNGYIVSIAPINNDYSQDWFFMVITEKPQFSNVIYSTGSILALIAAIIIVVASSIALLLFVNIITNQISSTAHSLFRIAQLNFFQRPKRHFSLIYELRLLQQGLNSIMIGLSSFAKYIPRSIVQNLLLENTSIRLGVVPSGMTILFCDIEDFTNTSESLEPSKLLFYMSQYFAVIANLIERNNGVVDKFIGDAVLGFWNHPYGKIEQHELLACKTALECVTLIKQLSNRFAKEGLPEINIRIGINSGNVLVGNVGSENRYNYTVLGDVTNIASRLEALNKVFETEILIGEETYEKVKNEYLCYWVELVQLKGKSQSLNVYELVAKKTMATIQQIEIANRLLEIKECLDVNEFERMIEKSEQLRQQFPEQSSKADYFITKANSLMHSKSATTELTVKSFVMQ